ncbi:MAG TPA: DUF1844 domain-containing protein [Kiritimatiellia bacterium]|nr:DUF1844 domain-containing protein [Kiritimatiellia bacterium]HRZ13323.1 DUF1844 domain-containing protein [Kiritimatiellia bacterium]HSA18772.1 DUF1844 domain-containing protein [Kiritimatiellia bacterium]
MKEEARDAEMHKSLFVQLVMMLATSASQAMGKLVNPATKKTEVNVEAAEATIDLLDMIEAKTKGNLDRDEERLLKDTLMSLKLTFVETRNAAPAAAPAESAEPAAAPGSKVEGGPAGQEPRFHKSY